jgi:uncharacterized protein with ATP-grasp and redox domains
MGSSMPDYAPQRPSPVRVGVNPFATNTFAVRKPKIVRDIIASNPDYPPIVLRDLAQLAYDLENRAPIPMISRAAALDYVTWEQEFQRQASMTAALTWGDCEWFFAETYLYRYIMQLVRWFESGRDPFLPAKHNELHSARVWELVNETQALNGDRSEKLSALLAYALWGNRADLSHAQAHQQSAEAAGASDWLADERDTVVAHLVRAIDKGGTVVHVICDNAGTELVMDLALVDGLLQSGIQEVVMHLKAHPTFVSDALVADVWLTLDAMTTRGGLAIALGERLRAVWVEGRLRLAPHLYWNSPHYLWDMPLTLTPMFAGATLVILKGDANYRRAIGDALWQPETPFAQVVSYFNAPLLALRTMKSDPVVGLPMGAAEELEALDMGWRTNGKRGVAQFAR